MSRLIVSQNGIDNLYTYSGTQNLLDILRELGYFVSAPCGGNGTCGKCQVFLQADGSTNKVLACQTMISNDCTVFLDDPNADLSWNETSGIGQFETGLSGYGAAVDLGTTTLAIKLYDRATGQCLDTISEWNRQKSYGADVISRIGCCIDHPDGLHRLSSLIRGQVMEMLGTLLEKHHIEKNQVAAIYLAGNTVMQHIFAGISPASIAAAPYLPATYFEDDTPVEVCGIPVYLFPCIAGYVGGDITAGLYSIGIHRRQEITLFLDVGTNGEMALGNANGIMACAVASGPAFEGAGLSCGMPAAYGAINSVSLTEEGLSYEVLGGEEPTGICGSGILDLIACLLELGYIDESGCLDAEENEDGEAVFYLTDTVYLTQKDVRQLQLAKAAVAAGIRLLMRHSGICFAQIDTLCLAGGFGNRLRPESAVRIGMLPEQLLDRIVPCGNTSLFGAVQALLSPSEHPCLTELKQICQYIELSSDAEFNDCFVEEMSFPEYTGG